MNIVEFIANVGARMGCKGRKLFNKWKTFLRAVVMLNLISIRLRKSKHNLELLNPS